MPVFTYQAFDTRARRCGGVIEADSPRAARLLLLQRGIRVAQLEAERQREDGGIRSQVAALARRMLALRQRERVLEAFENLVTMLESGVTLEGAWGSLVSLSSGRMRVMPVLHQLHDAVAAGRPFSQAMAEHPLHFDQIDVALVRAGENSGELAEALNRLVARRRLASKLSSTFVSAVTYPAFLFLFGCGVIVFLTGFVIPDLNSMLVTAGGEVPPLTKVLQAVGWAIGAGVLPAVPFSLTVLLILTRHFPRLKGSLARLALRLPVLGRGWHDWQLSQFCLVLRTLVASGIQLPQALALAGRASGEGPVATSVQKLRLRLLEGHDLAQPPREAESGLPPWLWLALAVGQASGDLPAVLGRVGHRFEEAALRSAGRLGAVLEPAMILLVGLFVGLVAYAALLPIVRLGGLW